MIAREEDVLVDSRHRSKIVMCFRAMPLLKPGKYIALCEDLEPSISSSGLGPCTDGLASAWALPNDPITLSGLVIAIQTMTTQSMI